MRLSEFIERKVDDIVDEWAEFAQTNIPPARELSPDALRDHAKVLLLHIADDLDTRQSGEEQHQKSRGRRPGNAPQVTKTARQDAKSRFSEGIYLNEMLVEFRAMRASVMRR